MVPAKGCRQVTAASSESDEDQEDDNVNCDNAEPHSDVQRRVGVIELYVIEQASQAIECVGS